MGEKTEFFQKIDELEKKHRVLLKRSCGLMLRETDAATMTCFYHILPHNVKGYDEDKWFAAACIHCLWDVDTTGRKPMEDCIALLKQSGDASDNVEKRLINLLDTPWDEDGFLLSKLGRMAKMLAQKGYSIDGESLIKALLYWNSQDRSVQKKWIKTYCNTQTENE